MAMSFDEKRMMVEARDSVRALTEVVRDLTERIAALEAKPKRGRPKREADERQTTL